MIDWNNIDTVMLDLDGTLLDLHFDNHFWLNHVPDRFANKHGIDVEQAKQELFLKYRAVEGSLDWYCVDYWSASLGLDIVQMKHEVANKISIRPQVIEFLQSLRSHNMEVRLVTNAHEKAVQVKMKYTDLTTHFDMIICSHEIGAPKEQTDFWKRFDTRHPFDASRTMLIDDNLNVLRAAREYGVP